MIIDDDIGMDEAAVREEGAYPAPDGVKVPFTDPDGGLELIYVLRDPTVEVLGVTCLYGVASERICEGASKRILEMLGTPHVPVLEGASSPADLGERTPAADFIIRSIQEHPGQVEVIASGPFTNIATALMLEPAIKDQCKTLHILSGEFETGSDIQQFTGLLGGDLNLSADYPATRYVFENGGPFPIYSNELMDEALFTRNDLRELAAAGTPLSLFVVSEVDDWLTLFSVASGHDGFFPHGMIAAAVVLDPSLSPPAFVSPVGLKVTGPPSGKFYWGSVTATRSDEIGLPEHAVYQTLSDPGRFRRQYMTRLR